MRRFDCHLIFISRFALQASFIIFWLRLFPEFSENTVLGEIDKIILGATQLAECTLSSDHGKQLITSLPPLLGWGGILKIQYLFVATQYSRIVKINFDLT